MLFNSLQFLIFFPIVTILYFGSPFRFRWLILLIASCYFYMFFIPYYILILFFTIVIDYVLGILIEKQNSQKKRKLLLVFSLISNIGLLCIFKYYNFFIENVNTILDNWSSSKSLPYLSLILPIGLSFHTFQAMSYIIEVYRGNQKAEKHFGVYALYVMFYPQLVAGPIERPQNVLPQLKTEQKFKIDNLITGVRLMLFGLFKKVVIADRIAQYVNPAFEHPDLIDGWQLLLATYLFAIQIYCDFSGYSDIALGSAKVMGIDLMQNFNLPYFSKSIQEFWSRWHISLSTWFRDYVYIPLGGNRKGKERWMFNLFIVFLISGLWHGSSWNFIIWGAIHGLYLIIAIASKNSAEKIKSTLGIDKNSTLYALIQIFITFNLVSFAWIFFRAETFLKAKIIIYKIFHSLLSLKVPTPEINSFWIISILLIGFLFLFESKRKVLSGIQNYTGNTFFIISFLLLIIVLGQSIQEKFIYFQF